jgi:Transposase DDE domain
LTIWFMVEAMAGWRARPRTAQGGQPRYSRLAIGTAFTLRTAFRLATRQSEGLIGSICGVWGSICPFPIPRSAEERVVYNFSQRLALPQVIFT